MTAWGADRQIAIPRDESLLSKPVVGDQAGRLAVRGSLPVQLGHHLRGGLVEAPVLKHLQLIGGT
jgi:hypothetical protein